MTSSEGVIRSAFPGRSLTSTTLADLRCDSPGQVAAEGSNKHCRNAYIIRSHDTQCRSEGKGHDRPNRTSEILSIGSRIRLGNLADTVAPSAIRINSLRSSLGTGLFCSGSASCFKFLKPAAHFDDHVLVRLGL